MATKVTPLGNNVLIAPLKQETQTESGIFLPDTASQEKPQEGTVVAVGDGEEVSVKPKQIVIYSHYGTTEVNVDGVEHVIVKAEDILAVIA